MTRGYLTKRQWSALLEQQNGKCCVADRRKKFGPTFKSKNTFRSHHRYG